MAIFRNFNSICNTLYTTIRTLKGDIYIMKTWIIKLEKFDYLGTIGAVGSVKYARQFTELEYDEAQRIAKKIKGIVIPTESVNEDEF